MYKLGLSSKNNNFTDEYFATLARGGIDVIEVSRCTRGYDGFDYDDIKEKASRFGITLSSLHLPFRPADFLDISRNETKEAALNYHKGIIDEGTRIGIKKFVLHPVAPNIEPAERSERLAVAATSLADLAEYADKLGAVIAVENMAHDCLGNTIEELEVLISAHPKLCVCFDVNHLLHDSHTDFIHRFGKRIVTTHISDCDLTNERHWMPGKGCIDFRAIIAAFREVGYEGPWLYEVSYEIPTPEGGLTVRDFVDNARALFDEE